MHFLLRQKIFRPLPPREAYTSRTLQRTFPTGEWVEEPPAELEEVVDSGAPVSTGTASPPPPSSITIIGDAKDLEQVYDEVGRLKPDRIILGRLPSGRGAESKISKMLTDCGWQGEVIHVDFDPDSFATDCNVEQVMSYDLRSPVLLVGNGQRVKQARSWLGRATWNREVYEL